MSDTHIDKPLVLDKTSAAPIPKVVGDSMYLPRPAHREVEERYSVVVYDVPIKEILFAIGRDSKLNVDIHNDVQGKITLNAVDQTLPSILERIAELVPISYSIKGNVLTVKPDWPELRIYKVDYVNMSRETKNLVGVSAEIANAGRAASTGASGTGGAVNNTGNSGGSNSSRTTVTSESNNHFWVTLINNIKDLLAETDKEILVAKRASVSSANTSTSSSGNNVQKDKTDNSSDSKQDYAEYKTLFAATVIANPETGVISVRGTQKQHRKVQEFLDNVMNSARRQVLIEATIVEVELNDTYQAGVDWGRVGQAAGSGFIFSQVLGPQVATAVTINQITQSTSGFVAGYFNSNRGISSSIQLLQQFGNTRVLSSPKLMVLNNQTAVLKVVNNLVYFTASAEVAPATTNSAAVVAVTTTAHTVPIGIVMSVTPQIAAGESVGINVRPTISQVSNYVRDPNPNLNSSVPSRIPEIKVQEIESLLQVNSGNIAVLGGLMQDRIQRDSEQVPVLASVPVLGNLFQSRNAINRKTELIVFLRPTIIKNASLDNEGLRGYKQYLPSQAQPISIE